ncbi:MAG: hypothetical protein ACXVAY_10665 [Mucilaginibacter sp.]
MRLEANKLKEISDIGHTVDEKSQIEEKIDSLIDLLAQNDFDSETVKQLQNRFNNAIEKKQAIPPALGAFKVIDEKPNATREELLDEFSTLLLANKFDNRKVKKNIRGEWVIKITLILLGIVMITLGFAMIIMPAPPYFEMFTIYYINHDDGITLMDLISLVIVLAGIYILVRGLLKKTTL